MGAQEQLRMVVDLAKSEKDAYRAPGAAAIEDDPAK
jgi:hypothetical protein